VEEIIEKKTIKGSKEKPERRSVNEIIQVMRAFFRALIALATLVLFAYVVHSMISLGSEELSSTAHSILQLLLGSFISIISGIATFYYAGGEGDIVPEEEKPKQEEKKNDSTTTTGGNQELSY
tara:strand:+ start:206 stop:574 length:369 start_codon:yes stop_codon:yes gene_type:complete